MSHPRFGLRLRRIALCAGFFLCLPFAARADDAGESADDEAEPPLGEQADLTEARHLRLTRRHRGHAPRFLPAPPVPPVPPIPPHVHLRGPPWRRTRVLILRERAPSVVVAEDDKPARPAEEPKRGGLALSAGGARSFGAVPLGDALMMGARVHVAAALPGESRLLSSGTLGLKGGVDFGTNHGVDAQLWRAAVALTMGAPWSRDVFGIGLEGGVLGGRYHDGNDVAYAQSARRFVVGPHGEGVGPRPYGLASLTLQVPLSGSARPFVAGEFGVTGRDDGRLASIAAITGGVVWNAW